MNRLEATVAAYSMAWEGCFNVTLTRHKSKEKVYTYFIPNIIIAGTDRDLLDTFCSLTGYGKVYTEKRKSPSSNQKAVYCWRMSGAASMKSFCEEVLPFLPSKKKQAELMIEFCGRRKDGNKVHDKTGYHTTYTFRDVEIWAEMKKLNQRGKRRNNENKSS